MNKINEMKLKKIYKMFTNEVDYILENSYSEKSIKNYRRGLINDMELVIDHLDMLYPTEVKFKFLKYIAKHKYIKSCINYNRTKGLKFTIFDYIAVKLGEY